MGGNKKILGVRLLNINGFSKDKYAYIENLFFWERKWVEYSMSNRDNAQVW